MEGPLKGYNIQITWLFHSTIDYGDQTYTYQKLWRTEIVTYGHLARTISKVFPFNCSLQNFLTVGMFLQHKGLLFKLVWFPGGSQTCVMQQSVTYTICDVHPHLYCDELKMTKLYTYYRNKILWIHNLNQNDYYIAPKWHYFIWIPNKNSPKCDVQKTWRTL